MCAPGSRGKQLPATYYGRRISHSSHPMHICMLSRSTSDGHPYYGRRISHSSHPMHIWRRAGKSPCRTRCAARVVLHAMLTLLHRRG